MTKTETPKPARKHQRRVTLNLIHHSSLGSPELRRALTALAGEHDWDMGAMAAEDLEAIYAEVDDELAAKATDEFIAEPSTIVDHKWTRTDVKCKLCGHPHIRFEFLLRNVRGGVDVWTGSRCIHEYGLNVEGEESAEAALEAIKRVIATAKRKYDRHIWRQEHPDHEMDIRLMRLGRVRLNRPIDVMQYRGLKSAWHDRVQTWTKRAEGAVAYYDKHGYLLPGRTDEIYGALQASGDRKPGGLLERMYGLLHEIDNAFSL